MISEKVFKKIIVIILIVALIVLALIMLKPVAIAIIWGLLLAYIFYPLYSWLLKRIREKNISALIIVLLAIFLLFLPIWFLFPLVSKQVFEVYSYFQTLDTLSLFQKILPWFFSSPTLQIETISTLNSFVSTLVSSIFSKFSEMLVNLPLTALKLVVVLFTFFFALKDGEKLKEYIKDVSPFNKDLEESLSKEFNNMTKAVVFGYIVTGVVQGIFTGLGLFVLGIPNALLLTAIAMFAAIIPVLGAWAVWVPAAIYLLTTGHVGAGIGLIIYGSLFISWIDNVLRIWIVSRKTKLNSGIVFIGMIGGLIVFGVLGLIIGPLILSYLIIMLDAYKQKKFADIFS